jgi:hypothetical protein
MKMSLKRGGALAIAAATALLSPSSAQATTTRVWTLGVMNRYILDDANRWLFPHMITKFGNLFYIELYGAQDSFAEFAPTSMRSRDTPVMFLQDSDLAPVQATAGGGSILSLTDDIFVSFHLSDYENATIRSFLSSLTMAAPAIVNGDPTMFPWANTGATPDALADANRKFDVFFAYNVQDLAAFGLLLSYGSSKYHYLPNNNDADILSGDDALARDEDDIGTSEFRFLLSGGLELGDSAAVDVGFGMGFHGLNYLANQRTDLIDGGGGIDLQADLRALIGVSEWWEIVPAVSFRLASLSMADLSAYDTGLSYNKSDPAQGQVRQTSNITDIKASRMLIDVGIAGHFRPNDIVQFWGATGFQIQRQAFQYEHLEADDARENPLEFYRDVRSADALPYLKLALEAKIFSWLDFRGGVVKYLRADALNHQQIDDQDTNQNQDNTITRDEPFFDYFVGVAAHYEGFFLDMQLDPDWFKRGPEFLSGAAGNMFLNGSLGYRY